MAKLLFGDLLRLDFVVLGVDVCLVNDEKVPVPCPVNGCIDIAFSVVLEGVFGRRRRGCPLIINLGIVFSMLS